MRTMSLMLLLPLLASALPASAAPYYGPAKRWAGIGNKFGWEDKVERDGRWRIDASVRRGSGDEATAMAMYRAAERARDAGYRYVALLGGHAWQGPGIGSATLYLRPAVSPSSEAECRDKRYPDCYVASVDRLLGRFGGSDGNSPGTQAPAYRDGYGRTVHVSPYGLGAAGGAMPPPSAPFDPGAPRMPAAPSARREAQTRFDAAYARVHAVSRGPGWSAGD